MKEFDLEEFLEAHSLLDVDCEHLAYNILDFFGDVLAPELEGLLPDVVQNLERSLASPGQTVPDPFEGCLVTLLVMIHEIKN